VRVGTLSSPSHRRRHPLSCSLHSIPPPPPTAPELRAVPPSGATHNSPPSPPPSRSRNSRRLAPAPPGGGDREWAEGARDGGRNPAMLRKFALACKTKTIEYFAEEEEEDEDADRFARSPLPGADGVLAGERVVVLKPDLLNPNPSVGGRRMGRRRPWRRSSRRPRRSRRRTCTCRWCRHPPPRVLSAGAGDEARGSGVGFSPAEGRRRRSPAQ
jgi:hypothetical protein